MLIQRSDRWKRQTESYCLAHHVRLHAAIWLRTDYETLFSLRSSDLCSMMGKSFKSTAAQKCLGACTVVLEAGKKLDVKVWRSQGSERLASSSNNVRPWDFNSGTGTNSQYTPSFQSPEPWLQETMQYACGRKVLEWSCWTRLLCWRRRKSIKITVHLKERWYRHWLGTTELKKVLQ